MAAAPRTPNFSGGVVLLSPALGGLMKACHKNVKIPGLKDRGKKLTHSIKAPEKANDGGHDTERRYPSLTARKGSGEAPQKGNQRVFALPVPLFHIQSAS